MSEEQEIIRGQEAEKVLNNKIYIEAMVAIRAELFNQFSSSSSNAKEEREELYRRTKTADWFEGYLNHVLTTGKMAEKSLIARTKTTVKKVIGL